MALTPKHQRFVEVYLVSGNASEAYREAGYKAKGRSIGNAASRLLGNVGMQTALADRRAQLATANDVTAEQVIEQWRRVAFFDPVQLATLAGQRQLLPVLASLPLEVRTALEVTIIANDQGAMVTLRPKSSEKALDRLSERLALFADTDPLTTLGTGMMGLLEARKQLAARLEELAGKARANGQGDEG